MLDEHHLCLKPFRVSIYIYIYINMLVVMEHDNVLFRRVAHRVVWVGVAFFGASFSNGGWLQTAMMRKAY